MKYFSMSSTTTIVVIVVAAVIITAAQTNSFVLQLPTSSTTLSSSLSSLVQNNNNGVFQTSTVCFVQQKQSYDENEQPKTVTSTSTSTSTSKSTSRRDALLMTFATAMYLTIPSANALDMDAFANAQLDADTKNCDPKKDSKCIPKLTQDEGLCKYGQSGNARSEACKRVKDAGGIVDKPTDAGRSLGGAYAM